MTSNEMQLLVGRHGWVKLHELSIEGKILNTRQVWGKIQLLIEPISGSGSSWFDIDSVEFIEL